MWYFSKFRTYLQALLTPLIIKQNPEEVAKTLNIIPKRERRMFFVKGIVYTFPKSM